MATKPRPLPQIDMRGGPAPKITSGPMKGQDRVSVGVDMRLTITYNVDMSVVMGQRNLNKNLRQANKDMLLYWHKEIREKHFTNKGFSEYRYQRRTRATQYWKALKYRHQLPIVLVGLAKTMSGNIKSLRATPKTAALTVPGPWYMGVRVRSQGGKLSPDLKKELSTISSRDAIAMAKRGADSINEALKKDKIAKKGRRTVKSQTKGA